MKKNLKRPAALHIAAVLFCLVLVTAHFTAGMYARYVTRAKGSDSAQTARFSVMATQNKAEIVAGEDGYQITVKNDSTVSVSYEAVIQFDNSADADRFESVPAFTGTLEPGQETTSNPFVLVLKDADGTGTAHFTVTVTFTQIN